MTQEQFDSLNVGDVVINPAGNEVLILTRSGGREYYDEGKQEFKRQFKFFLACNETLTDNIESRREWEPKR